MSSCFLIASDIPLPAAKPPREYPLILDLDSGTVDDGGAEDSYFLSPFGDVHRYTQREYGLSLEWRYTDGRAKHLIEYIAAALEKTGGIDLWRVWLSDYWEYEDRPYIHRKSIPVDQLTAEDIHELDDAPIWNKPDKRYPERPSFYCLTITGRGTP